MMLSAELKEIALNVLSFHRFFCVPLPFCIELKRRRRVCLCMLSFRTLFLCSRENTRKLVQ